MEAPSPEQQDRIQESRILSDAELLQGDASVQGGRLIASPEQKVAAEAEMDQAQSPAVSESTGVTPEVSKELLDEVVQKCQYLAGSWFTHTPREHGDANSKFGILTSEKITDPLSPVGSSQIRGLEAFANQSAIPDSIAMAFTSRGVSELVTALPESGGQPAMICYETLTLVDGSPYVMNDGWGRPGNYLRTWIGLPRDTARSLLQAIEQNPQIIRDIQQKIIGDRFNNAEGWVQPDYESWKEVNGGVNRIALRESMDATPEQSRIIEF